MNENILDILDEIHEMVKDEDNVSIYRNYKKILSTNKAGLIKLNEDIRENFEPPSKDIKVYKINYGIYKKWKPTPFSFGPFYINCAQLTITPELKLVQMPEDRGQTITYTTKELETIGFKKSHIPKIIKAVKNKSISFLLRKKVTITDVFASD
jgi:hypothetical protein